ncbi:MAG: hypothetical protein PUK21_07315 [Peptostreptococcaceae bacterium]|nr:hypothetical protein [Peptostreptococcaceae bacterium]MDY5739825.1 hypothetical protein [Anaerovoracaceae bacterium]
MTTIINAIPSKSIYHRVSICSFIKELQGNGRCVPVWNFDEFRLSDDMEATKESLARVEALCMATAKAKAMRRQVPDYIPVLDIKESGATLRFMLSLVSALGISAEFRTEGCLLSRPLKELTTALTKGGCNFFIDEGKGIIRTGGQLKGGDYSISGRNSSQFASGLLMALPILGGNSTLTIEKPIVSSSYIDMTLNILNDFEISIIKMEETDSMIKFHIPGDQQFRGPESYNIEGDWSNGAFWLGAEQITGNRFLIKGLNTVSLQADRKIVEYIKLMRGEGKVVIDGSTTPDLVPIVAVMAMAREGETVIENIEFLRNKESDRISGIQEILKACGGEFTYEDGTLRITGMNQGDVENSTPEFIYISTKDHRMVMMAVLASFLTKDPILIDGWENINKSYPGFFAQLHKAELDGNIGRA